MAAGEAAKPARRTPSRGAGSSKSPAPAKDGGAGSSKSPAGGKAGGSGSQAAKLPAKRKAKQVIDDDSDWEEEEEEPVGGRAGGLWSVRQWAGACIRGAAGGEPQACMNERDAALGCVGR